MIDPTFAIGLADLRRLSDAVCELDGLKRPRDLVYGAADGSERDAA